MSDVINLADRGNFLIRSAYNEARGTALRLRASDLAAIFEVYMLAVALGALKTALDLREPWFTPTVSFWVYAMTFVGSLALISVSLLATIVLVRPRSSEPTLEVSPSENPGPVGNPSPPPADEEMEEILKFLQRGAAPGENPQGGSLAVEETLQVAPVQARPSAAIPRPRGARRTLLTLLGPAVTATIFGGISAAFLPGADGFLQTAYTLNTFIVLVFSYGWVGLLAYTVGSLFLAASKA